MRHKNLTRPVNEAHPARNDEAHPARILAGSEMVHGCLLGMHGQIGQSYINLWLGYNWTRTCHIFRNKYGHLQFCWPKKLQKSRKGWVLLDEIKISLWSLFLQVVWAPEVIRTKNNSIFKKILWILASCWPKISWKVST